MEIVFVLPAGGERPTGGNLYNAGLIAALRRRDDVAVRETSVAGWVGQADAEAGVTYVVDSLCLEAIEAFAGPGRVVLLAHLVPGMDPEDDGARRRGAPRIDGAVATSRWAGDWLEARGLAGRVIVVPPAAPRLARREAAPGGTPRLLVVANLVPPRAVAELLAALAAAARADDDFELRVIGSAEHDPAYAARCAAAAADPRLAGRATLVGAMPPSSSALAAEYRDASLLLSAARIETYGMALAEARAVGIPLVVRDAGNAAAHVDPGATGVLARSVAEVAGAALSLVRDPAARARLEVGARAAPPPSGDWDAAAARLVAGLRDLDAAPAR